MTEQQQQILQALIESVKGMVEQTRDLNAKLEHIKGHLDSLELRITSLEFASADPKKVN
jgi:hypothetical protein